MKINQRYSDKLKVQKHKNKEAIDDYTDSTFTKPCPMYASGRVFMFSASPVSLKAELNTATGAQPSLSIQNQSI
ncbi:MAG: hypothetical protein Q7V19_03155 [Bacteroidales bacterium]|nr:hypothetical protein [Bacteroidales bacterium]